MNIHVNRHLFGRIGSGRVARHLVGRVPMVLMVGGLTLTAFTGCTADDATNDADAGPEVTAQIGDAATAVPTTGGPTTTASTPTTPPTVDTVPGPAGTPEPQQAADALYAAWKAGDRVAAGTVAEPIAVDGVFAAAPGDYQLYNKCNTGEFGQSSCLFRGDPGTIQFNMKQIDGSWVVTGAIFSPT